MDVVISQERGRNMDIDNKPESFSQKENDLILIKFLILIIAI